MIPWTAEKSIPSSLFDNRTIPANWKGLVYSYTLCFLDHIWYSLEHTGNARTYGFRLNREFQQEKRWHVESTGSRGQPEDNSWNAHAGTWNAYTGTWKAYTGTWTRGSQKKPKSFCLFFWWLFVLTFGGLFVPSFNEQTRGRVRAHKWNSLQKKTRLCRGWFTAYTYGLKGLSAYTGKPWTPIQGLHESLYWENCSPIPGKHPGIASKTPV